MNIEEERTKISSFLKAGIVVLTGMLLIAAAIHFLPDVISVSNLNAKKQLPIYCVDSKEKKVGLSFDAAWGNG